MSQVSDGVWSIIRSADGMKSEITETVQAVYDNLSNPQGKDNGESSCHKASRSVQNKLESNGDSAGGIETNGVLLDGGPNEPPGFGLTDADQRGKNNLMIQPNNIGMPTSHNGRSVDGNQGSTYNWRLCQSLTIWRMMLHLAFLLSSSMRIQEKLVLRILMCLLDLVNSTCSSEFESPENYQLQQNMARLNFVTR